MAIWLLITTWAYGACPSFERQVGLAETALWEARTSDASQALSTAERALDCGTRIPADLLARFWVADAASATFDHDADTAQSSFAAAKTAGLNQWNTNYGARLKGNFDAVVLPSGTGTIEVTPALHGADAYLDGRARALPVNTTPGTHTLQIVNTDGEVVYGSILVVTEGGTLTVRTNLAESTTPVATAPPAAAPPPVAVAAPIPVPVEAPKPAPVKPVPAQPVRTTSRARSPVWLIASGAAAAAAGGTALLALSQNGKMDSAGSNAALDAAYRKQVVWGVSSYAMMGVAATTLTLHFALPVRAR